MHRNPRPAQKIGGTETATRFILEKLAEIGEAGLDVFFPEQYTHARLARELMGLGKQQRRLRERASRRTFSAILSRLRSQGLVAKSGITRNSMWRITEKGALRLSKINRNKTAPLPDSDGITRLVIFDIPEQERKKRDSIRLELVAAGFKQLQKSVWTGDRPLPRDFLELLDNLDTRGKVHMFSVKEHGTLNRH